ncbi:MAG TPA: Rrf2 family transcriptional regulator [Candidatus Atribacteria bacterium]|nr:Rrf2 family transcriptional regulator [Candidatus Atribacteria bacterium]
MKISARGRYGLMAMLDLAVNSANEHISLYSIADRQNISPSYLEQVFSLLRKAGLVNSIKGAYGGYKLAGEPRDIRVGDIFRVLEGDINVAEGDSGPGMNSIMDCIDKNVWQRLNSTINDFLDSITLEDLQNEYHKMQSADNIMYYI